MHRAAANPDPAASVVTVGVWRPAVVESARAYPPAMAVEAARAFSFVEDVEPLARERAWPFVERSPAGRTTYGPSLGLQQGVRELLANADGWAAEHHAVRYRQRTPAGARSYLERLLCVTPLETPRTWVCELPNALVAGPTGLVLTDHREILLQSLLRGGVSAAKVALVGHVAALDDAPLIEGPVVSLLSFYTVTANYAHWLQDCLPRLALLDADAPCRVLVGPDPQPFQLECLELLGFGPDRVVRMRGPAVRVERLLLSSPSTRGTHPAPHALLEIAGRLRAACGVDARVDPGRRVYASRAGSRRVVNEEQELWPVLQRQGFEPVRCSRLSFAEQVRLFAGLEVIVGPHGADLHNVIFSAPDAELVELFSHRYLFLNVLRTAAFTGQRHWHLIGDTVGDDYSIRVDPARLDELLQLVLLR